MLFPTYHVGYEHMNKAKNINTTTYHHNVNNFKATLDLQKIKPLFTC